MDSNRFPVSGWVGPVFSGSSRTRTRTCRPAYSSADWPEVFV